MVEYESYNLPYASETVDSKLALAREVDSRAKREQIASLAESVVPGTAGVFGDVDSKRGEVGFCRVCGKELK